jgi:hypothetical protein
LITRGVHNLRHTFGHRLKAAGVSAEDRRVLLGHGKANATENYSLPDLAHLVECVERIEKRTETVILRIVRISELMRAAEQRNPSGRGGLKPGG